MFNFNSDNDKYDEVDLQDILYQLRGDAMERGFEIVMEEGISGLRDLGSNKPRLIVEKMIKYYSQPDIEEYEKCAELVKLLRNDKIKEATLPQNISKTS